MIYLKLNFFFFTLWHATLGCFSSNICNESMTSGNMMKDGMFVLVTNKV